MNYTNAESIVWIMSARVMATTAASMMYRPDIPALVIWSPFHEILRQSNATLPDTPSVRIWCGRRTERGVVHYGVSIEVQKGHEDTLIACAKSVKSWLVSRSNVAHIVNTDNPDWVPISHTLYTYTIPIAR